MNSLWQKSTFCMTFLDTWALWIWKWRSANSVERLRAFKTKLFSHHTSRQKEKKYTHKTWYTLHTSHPSWQTLTKPTDNFTERFQDFSIPAEVPPFAHKPFTVQPETASCVRAEEATSCVCQCAAFICFKTSLAVWVVSFLSNHVSPHQYPAIRKVALLMRTVFASTCTCELSISQAIKTRALYLSISVIFLLTRCEPNHV